MTAATELCAALSEHLRHKSHARAGKRTALAVSGRGTVLPFDTVDGLGAFRPRSQGLGIVAGHIVAGRSVARGNGANRGG